MAEIGAISASLQRERPDTHRGIHLRAESLNRRLQGGLQRPALALLAGALLIFLVAVANVSNLLLIQFSESRGALTLRLAVGASLAQVRLMLWQQWMVLIGLGAASGIASTLVTTRALRIWIESEVAPFAIVSMDGSILLAVLALLILLLGGVSLAPSLSLRSLELRSALAIGARSIAPGRNRTRHAAVATQVAIALTVLFLAGLLVRSYSALSKAPLGFNTDRLLTFRLDLASPGLPDPASRFRFVETFLERARAVPEVEAASVWGPSMLGSASWVVMVAASAESRDAPDGLTMAFRHNVNPGGLRALGIDIVAGRDVETSDTLEAPPVGIISESLAKQMWPGDPADTVGRALVRRPPNPPILVVGVARDVRHRQRYSFADIAEADFIGGLGPQRDIYFPITQRRNDTLATFAVRLTSARSDSVRDLREIARDLNQDVAVSDVAFLDQRIAAQEAAPRAMGFLMICCAGIAAFLCILGVYAVSSYDVSLRSAEMGIRAALGASPAMLARSVIASIGWPVALGCAVGGGFSAVAARAVDSILFGIAPMDPIAFLAAALILGAGTLLALAPAARRAIRLDPALVLRN